MGNNYVAIIVEFMKKGYPQNLDNGVMSKPTKPDTNNRTSRSMDFKSIIADGENPNGQTSISPAQVTRGGETAGRGYDCYRPSKPTDGERWGSNPNLNEGGELGGMNWIPGSFGSKKKK